MVERIPVYRSFLIPFEGKYVREVTEEDKELWNDLLKDLREFLKSSLNLARGQNKEGRLGGEGLELVADLISFFFRAPLTADPLLSLAPSPPKLYFVIRLGREARRIFFKNPIEGIKQVIGVIGNGGDGPLSYIYSEEARGKISRAWLIFPADTRPGANTSSLVSHLLTTSSICWSLAYNQGIKDRKELALLRIVSQLHDIAKPIEPREHFKASEGLVDLLFSDILDKDLMEEIKEMIRTHHSREDSPIHEADRISASIDRVKEVVKKTIGEDFNRPEFREIASEVGGEFDVFELAYGGGGKVWDFWIRLESGMPGKIKELSENFVKRLNGPAPDQAGLTPHKDLAYYLIDIGGVQKFVYRSRKLSAVAAASLYIDYLTALILPLYIQEWFEDRLDIWMPLESFLITSGANFAGILPSKLRGLLSEALDDLCNRLNECNRRNEQRVIFNNERRVNFNLAIVPFYLFYPHIWRELSKEMALTKIIPKKSIDASDVGESINPDDLCMLCYRQVGRNKTNIGLLCDVCSSLVDFGKSLGTKTKWEKGFILSHGNIIKPNDIWGQDYGDEEDPDSIAANVMELISGMDPNFTGRELNVAVIKGDGNRMGEFFSKSISISDALERSFRVDQSLKTAYETALRAILSVNDSNSKKDICRIWLGTIYMGGDDFLIISPSWLSLPLAYIMVKEFESQMGGKCSLSLGIAATPPKHSVWHAISAADEIMEGAKKRIGRRGLRSAISFDVVEQGLMSDETVRRRMELQRSYGLSMRPLPINDDGYFSMEELLRFFRYQLDSYEGIMRHAYNHRPLDRRGSDVYSGQENQVISYLKNVRNAVRSAVAAATSMLGEWDETNRDIALFLSALYCSRESKDEARTKDIRDAFQNVAKLLMKYQVNGSKKDARAAPLLDLDICAKILGGGAV